MKRLFSFIAILSLLLMGCDGLGVVQPGDSGSLFSETDLAKLDGVSGEGGSVSLPFTPPYNWEANANKSWISVTPESGLANESVVLKVALERNESGAHREGNIFVELNNGTIVKLVVKQKALENPGTEEVVMELVDGNTYEIDANGGNLNVKVRTNTEYEVYIPASAKEWLSVADTRAVREDVLTFTATKNDSGDARQANVKLFYESEEIAFTISQEAAKNQEVEKPTISVSPRVYNLVGEGGEVEISVTSNADWSATCDVADVTLAPTSGNGNGTVKVTVPATKTARDIEISFTAVLNDATVQTSAIISQSAQESGSTMTPGEHQEYLESTGQRLLKYFNPNDSKALAQSLTELGKAGGFDCYLEEATRANTKEKMSPKQLKASKTFRKLSQHILGITRFSPESAARLSTTLILPEDDGTFSLDDYKGKQYTFNFSTGKWKESDLGNVNKFVAVWGTSTATITWEEGSASWEGYLGYDYKAKVQGIPSKLNFDIKVNGNAELTTDIEVKVPSNYEIDTKTNIWLNGGYTFTVHAKADRKGSGGSVIVAKNSETLATAGGAVSINDMTDSKNWWQKYYCEWCEEYHTDFNYDYPVNYVKTGEAYVTILDIGLQAEGNFRAIIEEMEKIEDLSSRDGSRLLCDTINNNASAVLYYTSSKDKIADLKVEPIAYEYWGWDEKTGTDKLMTEYEPNPVLIFTDGSKFAIDEYFTELAFGNLIDSAEELWEKYLDLVE